MDNSFLFFLKRNIDKYFVLSILLTIFSFCICGAFLTNSSTKALYNNNFLEKNLPNGLQSAYQWDACRWQLQHTPGSFRKKINDACSYDGTTWLSLDGRPNTKIPIEVEYGTTEIPLQINSVTFLAGTLVHPEKVHHNNNNANIMIVVNDGGRWANTTNKGADRKPNPIGNSGQRPALAGTSYIIDDVIIDKALNSGDSITKPAGNARWRHEERNNNTRYWFAQPIKLKYRTTGVTNANLAEIKIKIKYREAMYFRAWGEENGRKGWGYNHTCFTKPTDSFHTKINLQHATTHGCLRQESVLHIQIRAKSVYKMIPYSSTTSKTVSHGGVINRVASSVNNGGPSRSRTAATATARFVIKKENWHSFSTSNYFKDETKRTVKFDHGGNYGCDVLEKMVGSYPKHCEDNHFGNKDGGGYKWPAPSGGGFYKGNNTTLNYTDDATSASLPGLQIGDRICYASVINRHNQSAATNDWRISAPVCVTVAKSPKVHVLGGDIITGGELTSSRATMGSTSYTNFSEFATFSAKTVGNFSSHGDHATGDSNYNLTFANTNSEKRGCFHKGDSNCDSIVDIPLTNTMLQHASRFAKNGAIPLGPTTQRIGNYEFKVIKKSGGEIGDLGAIDRPTILVSNDKVTINKDIRYSSNPLKPVSEAAKLPQLIILAPDIDISEYVGHIDAWLVAQPSLTTSGSASGVIDTCHQGNDSNLNSEKCSNQLRVNGPVIANKIYLKRTYGSGGKDDQGVPAEIFNLPPETYSFLRNYSVFSNHSIQTIYVEEVSPRY